MKRPMIATGLVCALATAASGLLAADHLDSPAAEAEPSADITDLYAWMTPDASKLNLVLNVSPFAGSGAMFSDAVVYVIHVNSMTAYGQAATETTLSCKFYTASKLECWAGSNEYVEGDPSSTAGLTSSSGKLRVFAGMRNDPFFFELDGFKEAVKGVVATAPNLTFDTNGCPAVDAPTSAALVSALQHGKDGAAGKDTFAHSNVMSIVIQVDKSVVNSGGPVLGVWASTHRAQ